MPAMLGEDGGRHIRHPTVSPRTGLSAGAGAGAVALVTCWLIT
jgi:hypothetical protein